MTGRNVVANFFRFILLIVLQVYFFNHLLIFGWGTPLLYPLFILLLPINLAPSTVLFLSFGTGLIIDFLSNGGGIHAASLTAMGFFRKPIMDMLSPQSGYEKHELPNLKQQRARWFALYTTSLIFVHHFCFFMLEVFSFDNFLITLGRTLVSSALTLMLVWFMALLLIPPKKLR